MSPYSLLARASLLSLAVGLGACAREEEAVEASSSEELNANDEGNAVLFNLDGVKNVELAIDPAGLAAMTEQAHRVQGNPELLWEKRLTAKGTFRVNLAAGQAAPAGCDLSKTYDVEVKIKGMASVQGFDAKPSLRVDFDKSLCGVKNLALNNMVQDTTFVNESLAYKMYDSMGVPAPRLGFSSVTVNGSAMGVYLALETIDKKFLARTFGDGTGPIYEGTYGGDLRDSDVGTRTLSFNGDKESPEAQGNPQMHELVAAVNAPGDAVFYGPGQLIDTAEFVSMMATAFVIGDWDNYVTANNYRLYRNPKTNLWSWIPTGTDQTFAIPLHPMQGSQMGHAPSIVFEKCQRSPRCSADYIAAVGRAVAKLQEPEGTLVGTATRRAQLVAEAVRLDTRRPQTDEAILAGLASVIGFIQNRPGQVGAMMALPGAPAECGVLHPNEGLVPGREIRSCSGGYFLTIQPTDGNLVLYRADGAVLWATNTPTMSLFVQDDGNVVAYDASRAPLWASTTDGHGGAILAVQDDGNLVVYAPDGTPLWDSGTVQ